MLEPKRKERDSQFFETYLACVLTLQVARPEGSIGPEPHRVSGVNLWRHLPFKGVLSPMQCTTTRIDS